MGNNNKSITKYRITLPEKPPFEIEFFAGRVVTAPDSFKRFAIGRSMHAIKNWVKGYQKGVIERVDDK